jgi:branched-chain amino acid aminotransferase
MPHGSSAPPSGCPWRRFRRSVSSADRLVAANRRFVPPHGLGSFYIRPMQHAVDVKLGFGACRELAVTMYGSPVGAVGSKTDSIRLQAVERARVAPGGTGAAKAIGNYAGGVHVAGPSRGAGLLTMCCTSTLEN